MANIQQRSITLPRRRFLGGATALAAVPLALPQIAHATETGLDDLPHRIINLFTTLPGDVAIKIFAPSHRRQRGLQVNLQSAGRLFVGSAIKTFVLAEALRQADSPDVVQTISERQLALNASVWNLDSQTFNPPNLIGHVSERTALEAMICTATTQPRTCR